MPHILGMIQRINVLDFRKIKEAAVLKSLMMIALIRFAESAMIYRVE
jgi:hypothetical protein